MNSRRSGSGPRPTAARPDIRLEREGGPPDGGNQRHLRRLHGRRQRPSFRPGPRQGRFRLVADQSPRRSGGPFAWCSHAHAPGCHWEFHTHSGGNPATVRTDSAYLRAASKAVESATGKRPVLIRAAVDPRRQSTEGNRGAGDDLSRWALASTMTASTHPTRSSNCGANLGPRATPCSSTNRQ